MSIGKAIICDICRKKHQKDKCYLNTKTNEIFCLVCLAEIKKERNIIEYKRILPGCGHYTKKMFQVKKNYQDKKKINRGRE